jgi:hypothetical protein
MAKTMAERTGNFTKARVLSRRLPSDNHKDWDGVSKSAAGGEDQAVKPSKPPLRLVRIFSLRKSHFLTGCSQPDANSHFCVQSSSPAFRKPHFQGVIRGKKPSVERLSLNRGTAIKALPARRFRHIVQIRI